MIFLLTNGDISVFKMAAIRHLGIVLLPYETTHEVCCWPQLPVKLCQSDIQIRRYSYLNFRIFGLKCLFWPPKWGVWGDFGPLNAIIHHGDPKRCILE